MRRLVLLGGGHAHVKVLADLAERPLAGWDVHLVTPYRRQIYSGMLPGWIAGHYPIESCAISLDALAARANVTFHETAGIGLDHGEQRASLRRRHGPAVRQAVDRHRPRAGPGARCRGARNTPCRSVRSSSFIAAWPALVDRMLGRCRRFDLVILGGGAAGVELAFAIAHRATVDGWSHLRIALAGSDALPLEGAPAALRRRAAALLVQRGIAWHGERRASRIEPGQIHFERDEALAFDACLVVTGAAAPDWPRRSGLATDERGFIRVGPTLQSVSHPHILAAGDVAAYHDARPKSGVYAVRAGPILAENLRASCEGRPLRDWAPQRRALYLISTGDRHALASWGRWAWSGDWVWHWKDRIDRRFMQRFGTGA